IEYMQWLHDNPKEFYRCVREAKRIVNGMLECDKPIICKVNGDAIGLGATVAVFCDMIFAADTARFGDPHNNVGLTTGYGGQLIWQIGRASCRERGQVVEESVILTEQSEAD